VVLLGASGLPAADPFQEKALPFLGTYCVRCHNPKTASGDLDLTRFTSTAKVLEDFRQWEQVLAFLKKEEMPPAKAKQPPAALRAEIVSLGGAECRLLREIDALKARLAETESKNGARTNAANAPGWLRMLVHR
jgi:hypothetical protein